MAHYIDKDALVAEIEKRIADITDDCIKSKKPQFTLYGKIMALENLLPFLNILDAKDVDLDFQTFAKEMETVFALPSSRTKNTEEEPLNWEYVIAKHFFELGLAQKGEKV